jgi:hypothetical protein
MNSRNSVERGVLGTLGQLILSLSMCLTAHAGTTSPTECPNLQPRFPSAHVSIVEIRDLFTEVTGRAGTRCREFGRYQVQCDAESQAEVWIFTLPGHPAYPAVSRGEIRKFGALLCILRDGYFAGDEPAFAAWLGDLTTYDKQVINRFRQSL